MPDITAAVAELTDEQLKAKAEEYGAAVKTASDAYEPFLVERIRRAVLTVFPEGQVARLESENWDNGTFLTIREVLDDQGHPFEDSSEIDIRQEQKPEESDLAELLADLTDMWGAFAEKLALHDEVPAGA